MPEFHQTLKEELTSILLRIYMKKKGKQVFEVFLLRQDYFGTKARENT